MVDQDINKEAAKIEGLAEKSLQGDKEAANELSREITDLMKKDPEYLKRLQTKIDADEKTNAKLPNIEIEGPARVIIEERQSDQMKWDGSKHVPVLDKQIYQNDGTVKVTPTDALAPAGSDKKYLANDRVQLSDVGNKEFQEVRTDAAGRPSTILRYNSRIEIERDQEGNPTKISGVDGQTWTKDAGADTWSVVDKDGNQLDDRTDVVVKPNGEIVSKGVGDAADGEHVAEPFEETLYPNGLRERTYTDYDNTQSVVMEGPRTITYKGLDKNPYSPERDENGKPIEEVTNPVHYKMEKDEAGRVTSIERGKEAGNPESVKFEYDKEGNPTRIEGLEGKTYTKNENGTWTIEGLDKDGNPTKEYALDVEVKPNGDVEMKQVQGVSGDLGKEDEPMYREPAEIKTVHLDGSTSSRPIGAKPAGVGPMPSQDKKSSSDPLFTSGQCQPGDPLCSTL